MARKHRKRGTPTDGERGGWEGFEMTPEVERERARWHDGVLERMKQVAGGVAFREIGLRTGVHPENVRRYLTMGRPSAFFVAGLCRVFGVSPTWLLFGDPLPSTLRGDEFLILQEIKLPAVTPLEAEDLPPVARNGRTGNGRSTVDGST